LTPDPFDWLFFCAFAVAYPLHGWWTWPKFVARARSGKPGVRVRAYLEVIAVQWSLALALVWHWRASGRSWAALGLGDPFAGAGPVALAIVAAICLLAALHVRGVSQATPQQLADARLQLGEVQHLLPHDAREQRIFNAVAFTAGSCEELVYRGFVPWLFAFWISPGLALVGATALFGLGHAYQGPVGIVKTTAVGAIMALLVWWSGTLWPAIVLHVVVDIHGGLVGGRIVRAPVTRSDPDAPS
jgi:membrane protease YdiL (CAAX protease family)